MTRPTQRENSSVFQFKKRVPSNVLAKAKGATITLTLPAAEGHAEKIVQARVGDVVKLSLHTRTPSVAKGRTGAVEDQLQALWPAMLAGPKPLTSKQIVALAGTLYKAFTEALEHDPGRPELWAKVLKQNLDALSGRSGGAALIIGSADAKRTAALEHRFGQFVDALLTRHALVIDAESRKKLLLEVARQMNEAARRLAQTANHDYSPDEFVSTLPAFVPETKGKAAPPAAGSIMGVFTEWEKIVVPSKGIAAVTVNGYRHAFKLFVKFLGHNDFAQLQDDSVNRFAEDRVANGTKPRTVNDGDLSALKSVFGWAVKSKRIPYNPAQGVRVPQGKKARTRERGFTDAEAKAILTASLRYKQKPAETDQVAAAKKWVPWLCAFTGARVSEMVQLRKQDVRRHEDGHYEATITPEAGGVKSKEFRRVPLHPQLVELGFIKFVNAASDGPLFRRVKKGKTVGRGGVKNRLQEFVREIVPDERVQPNHGWRHRFITLARKHKISEELRRMITGHKGKSVDETDYGDAAGLYEEICKLPPYTV